MMVIYEVNLIIDKDIFPQFELWLKSHVAEMLLFDGFIQAYILHPEQEEQADCEQITVQYLLENGVALDNYFREFASNMREKGLALFKDKFSASRRIFKVQDLLLRHAASAN